jgi:hypothetical protein
MVLSDVSTKSHAKPPTMVEAMYANSFVFSLMGVDAGEPLNHIFTRKGK